MPLNLLPIASLTFPARQKRPPDSFISNTIGKKRSYLPVLRARIALNQGRLRKVIETHFGKMQT